MRTLYTGHVTIGKHYVYAFIYAETMYEAEEHLAEVLERYIRERHQLAASLILPRIKIVSRPTGWNPPDGFYLPGTSRQYALRYPSHVRSGALRETAVYESECPTTPHL